MLTEKFLGYREGADIASIPSRYLTYPSKNAIIYKGVAQTRSGTTNDGTAPTEETGINGQYVWTDAKSGRQAIRTFGQNLQIKLRDKWFTIFSGLSATASRIRFATWVDGNGSVIKKRLFFVDGSINIHEWNGAVGVVASYDAGAFTATLDSAAASGLLRGFDAGLLTAVVVRFDVDGNVLGTEEKTYSNDGTSNTIVFSGALTNAPQAGDLIVAKPITNTGTLTAFPKDDIFTFPVTNHLVVTNTSSGEIYGSNSLTKLDYTIPAAPDRTAASPFFLTLPGNIQVVVSRSQGNSESQPETIWFSTEDSWYKVIPLSAASAITGHWFEIQALELPPRSGALPFMAANFKGDIVFVSQGKRLQRVQTLELVGKDDITLLSDEVDGLLARLSFDGGNMYYDERYIWLTAPVDSNALLLDMVGDADLGIQQFWNPPQIVPVAHISVIDGVRYGHSSTKNETFTLFDGTDDLGIEQTATIALGTTSSRETFLKYLTHTSLGISGKKSVTTIGTVSQYFEKDGAKAGDGFILDDVKAYFVPDDTSYATVPWASRATGDLITTQLRRFFGFTKNNAISYFEHRIIIEITGTAIAFHLHGIDMDVTESAEPIGEDLFITR